MPYITLKNVTFKNVTPWGPVKLRRYVHVTLTQNVYFPFSQWTNSDIFSILP